MKAYDFYAVAWQGNVYCVDCVPQGAAALEAEPVFASNEVDSYPSCDVCGELHDYMQLTSDGQRALEARERGEDAPQADEVPLSQPFADKLAEWQAAHDIANERAPQTTRELVKVAIDDLDNLLEQSTFAPGADQPVRVRAVDATHNRLGALERRVQQDDYTNAEATFDLEWLRGAADLVRTWIGGPRVDRA